jgi:hypothetical protein
LTPQRKLPLRHPGQAHALTDPLEPFQENWIVALGNFSEKGDGVTWSERKSRLDRRSRIGKPPKMREGGSEHEMRNWHISVGFERSLQPPGRLLIGA